MTGVENEKEIVGEAERLDIKEKAPLVLAELLLDASILTQIKTYRKLFFRVSGIDVDNEIRRQHAHIENVKTKQ